MENTGWVKKGHRTLNLNISATIYPTEMVQYLKRRYGCHLSYECSRRNNANTATPCTPCTLTVKISWTDSWKAKTDFGSLRYVNLYCQIIRWLKGSGKMENEPPEEQCLVDSKRFTPEHRLSNTAVFISAQVQPPCSACKGIFAWVNADSRHGQLISASLNRTAHA